MPEKERRNSQHSKGRSIVSLSLPTHLHDAVTRARHSYHLNQSEFVRMVLVQWINSDKPARRYAPPEEYDERDE